jgi:hypothetical protein
MRECRRLLPFSRKGFAKAVPIYAKQQVSTYMFTSFASSPRVSGLKPFVVSFLREL